MSDVDDRESGTRDLPSPLPPTGEAGLGGGTDALSDVLRNVRLEGAAFFLWETSSPYATTVPAGDRFATALLPRAQQIVSYHVLLDGGCWGGLIGEPPIRLRAGDVLLVPRGDAYAMASSEALCRAATVDEEEAIGFFRAMAAGELPLAVAMGGGGRDGARVVCGFLGCDLRPFNPVLAALPPIVRLGPHAGPDDRLHDLASYALAETRHPGPGSAGVLTRLGELMFLEVIRRCLRQLVGTPRGWLAGMRDPVVGRCLSLMHRRPAEPWTLGGLADAVGCSRSHLAERFAGRLGEPPIQYLARWRCQLATHLLEDETLTVEHVAHRVGYGSGPAFSRAFKRLVGVAPGAWRRHLR